MAQGTLPMERITSAKFRVFLAENAVNFVYIANLAPNILLKDNNIGCPNISSGLGCWISFTADIGCDLYEYMAIRTVDKIIHFFEEGQEVILRDTVVQPPEPDEDEVDALGKWDTLKTELESGAVEKLLEVGIGAGADDSEWYRQK
jgi:hypothetical protein